MDSYFAEQSVEDRHQADTVEEAKLGHAPKVSREEIVGSRIKVCSGQGC